MGDCTMGGRSGEIAPQPFLLTVMQFPKCEGVTLHVLGYFSEEMILYTPADSSTGEGEFKSF